MLCTRLRIYEGGDEIIDTGLLYDRTLRGGRLGFFVLSQPQVIWSDLSYRCKGKALFVASQHHHLMMFYTLVLLRLT